MESDMLAFRLREELSVPLDAEALSPDVVAGLALDAVRVLPVYLGKRSLRVDDLFGVSGQPSDHLEIRGDLRKVKWIGKSMSRGRIDIVGDVGMHLGSGMTGGEIHVRGGAGDWLGAEMRGGVIHVEGDAGGQVGGAYRGSMSGMSGGTILIGGTAGVEVGMRMKRGTIAVRGRVGDFAGLQMKGGTLVLLDGAERRPGAWMTRGAIVSLKPLSLSPTFAYACDDRPTFLRVYAKHLDSRGFRMPSGEEGLYRRHFGDSAAGGKGEIFEWIRNS